MEIRLGTIIETLVDLKDIEGVGNDVFIPKGTRGTVCDISHIKENFVLVEIYGENISKEIWGVYSYNLKDIKVVK